MNDEVIVLTGNKKQAILLLLGSAAFVAIGIALVANGKGMMAWGVVIFFGLCFLTSLYMLTPNATRLRIDKNGIEMTTFFKPMKLEWSDVNGFYVAKMRTGYATTKMIGIEFSESYKKLRAGRQFASALTGVEGALPNHFNRPAEEICELLNKSKQRWGRAPDNSPNPTAP